MKGCLKIHLAVNVESKRIRAMDVTREYVYDGRRLKRIVDEESKRAGANGLWLIEHTFQGTISDF